MAISKKKSHHSSTRKKVATRKLTTKRTLHKKMVLKGTERKPECMVIMPFGGSDSNYPSHQTYETIIVPAIKRALGKDADFYRFDQKDVQGPIKTEIIESLRKADVVVADISE